MSGHRTFASIRNALLCIVLVVAALSGSAAACSCSTRPISPCNSLSGDGVIFLGTVQAVENRPLSEFVSYFKSHPEFAWQNRYAAFRDEVVVVFEVQETFKGNVSRRAELRVGKYIGSCGFEYKPGQLYFKKGEQYLVYAGETNGHLATNHCSRTRLASNVAQDIEALRALSQLPAPRLIGQYNVTTDKGKRTAASQGAVTLIGTNGKQITTVVQPNGDFSVTPIPPDTYHVKPTVPKNFRIQWYEEGGAFRLSDGVPINPKTITVQRNGCRQMELHALPDGRLSGTVTDIKGRPLTHVGVRLWDSNNVTGLDHWWGWDQTNERGEFEVSPLPPGNYVIGVYIWSPEQEKLFSSGNDTGKPKLWFYPGVANPSSAYKIPLKFAQHRSGLRLRVPAIN